MSREHYIAGGITGSIVGFGIGHAIQGRYKEKGWIFTLVDGLAMGTIIGGSVAAMSKIGPETVKFKDPRAREALPFLGLSLLGGALYTGFRIWEIIGLWKADFDKDGH